MIRFFRAHRSPIHLRLSAAVFCLLLGVCLRASAQGSTVDEIYPYRVEPSVIDSLKKGPNAEVYAYRHVIALMKSDRPIDSINFSTVNAEVFMYGKYNSPRGMVDLELRGEIRNGVFDIDFPLGRVDAVLFDWEEKAARPEPLKNFKPQMRSLVFRDTSGFRAIYAIQRDLTYDLTVDIPYNPVTKELMPPQPDFRAIAEFLKALETNKHSRDMIANNATGVPTYLGAGRENGTLVAGYLLNTVKWNERDHRWEYSYDDSVKHVRDYPEMRWLLKDPVVKSFVAKGETRVKAIGSEKTGFSFVLLSDDGKRLEASLVGRRVIVKRP